MTKIRYFMAMLVVLTAFSCTTLGKPIEECFVPADNIANFNMIGIVSNRASGWEYRLCVSNKDGDIVVDGTLKNVFNTTLVDVTVDNTHFTGKLEYKTQSMLTSDLYVSLIGDSDFVVSPQYRRDGDADVSSDRMVTAHITINGPDELWDMSLLGKKVTGRNTVNRTDAQYSFDMNGLKYGFTVSDILRGKVLTGDFGGRHFSGRTQNVITVIKYFLNSEDLSEEDVLLFTTVDLVRLLRSAENKRR